MNERFKPIQAGTAGILGTFVFLLVWGVVERVTHTAPKAAPPGTTVHAARSAGAKVMPTDRFILEHYTNNPDPNHPATLGEPPGR